MASNKQTNNKRAAGVDNTHRKTWDKTEYEDKAKERQVKVGHRRFHL
jgi:hypothetical protein